MTRFENDERGFTLVEVLASLVLASVLSAVAVGGFGKLARAQEQDGTVRELVSALRNAQSRAVAEARTYCVQINAAAGTYRLRRGDASSATPTCDTQVAGSYRTQGSTRLSDVTFPVVSGLPTVFFTARGSATSGSLRVTRPGTSRVNAVTVEGLTARVTSS